MMVKRIVSELIESNVFMFSNEKSCVIIDAGASLEKIKNEVENKKIEAIFLTHGHYDHCFYAMEYAKEFGCKIYCSNLAKEYLENATYNYSEGHFKIEDFSNFVFLEGAGCVNFDEIQVKFFQLGGHSKGDMCYQIGDDIFVGDVLIGRDMGRIDLYGGDKKKMKESLEFLTGKDYQIMHSGHGIDNDKIVQDKVAKLWLRYLSRD